MPRKRRDPSRPTIIIDTREQRPLAFKQLPTLRSTLETGDYSIKGWEKKFTVERKSIPDLVRSVTLDRERFIRELERIIEYEFRRLLIVGSPSTVRAGNYRSRATPKSIFGSIHAFEMRYNLPIVWTEDRYAGGKLIERWAYYYIREKTE